MITVASSMSGSFGDDSNNGGCGSAPIADQPIVSSQFSMSNYLWSKSLFCPSFLYIKGKKAKREDEVTSKVGKYLAN